MIRRQPVDARGENRLHRRRDFELAERLGEFGCPVAHQCALIEQHQHRLFHEERIAFGLLDDQPLERLQVLAVAEQAR